VLHANPVSSRRDITVAVHDACLERRHDCGILLGS
jgi:hypothetical protein